MDSKSFYSRYWENEHIKRNSFDNHPGEWSRENFNYHYGFFKPYIGSKVLDFGCGKGDFLGLLKGKCEELYGIDISEQAIVSAKDKHPTINFEVMQEDKLPYQDGFFDTVFAIDVLEHILDIETALEEINRVLKVSGNLLIATSELTRFKMILITLKGFDDYFYPASPHIRHFTRHNLSDILCEKGFKVIEYKKNRTYFGFIPQGQMVVAKKL